LSVDLPLNRTERSAKKETYTMAATKRPSVFERSVEITSGGPTVPSAPAANIKIILTADTAGGLITVKNEHGETIRIDGIEGGCHVGGSGVNGMITLQNSAGHDTIQLTAESASLVLGNHGSNGDLNLIDANAIGGIHLYADGGNIILADRAGAASIILAAEGSSLTIGSQGSPGKFGLFDAAGREVIFLQADGSNVFIGNQENSGNLRLVDVGGRETIHLQGDGGNIRVAGDITLTGADCAEEFCVAGNTRIEPGTVVALNEDGCLRECRDAYDRSVAGVVSGAGEYKPAIRMGTFDSGPHRLPVALVGKVYCKADASFEPIKFGDLLTSSTTPGFAMKASDRTRAFGSVIGKALRSLEFGRGLIPVLVSLQ
jgi:hypothetical protein